MRYINLLLTLSIDIDVSACRSIREGNDDVSRPEDQQEENVDQAQYVEYYSTKVQYKYTCKYQYQCCGPRVMVFFSRSTSRPLGALLLGLTEACLGYTRFVYHRSTVQSTVQVPMTLPRAFFQHQDRNQCCPDQDCRCRDQDEQSKTDKKWCRCASRRRSRVLPVHRCSTSTPSTVQYVESGIQRGDDVRRTSTHRRGSLSRRQRIPPCQVRVVHRFG